MKNKRVRIKNYDRTLGYNGEVGTVITDHGSVWRVVLDNGIVLFPYSPNACRPQCEVISEESEVLNNYQIC